MLVRIFPFLAWFKGYNIDNFKIDLLAGITVALVLIPQSMAYAQLAGLPAYYGLYASFLPPIVAVLFGCSRQLATGPVAIVSLMSAASLEPLATAGSADFIAYSILLALVVGIFQLCLGLLRLGLVVNFLSHPVVKGFTNAAAIIIASSQFSKFFGVHVDKAPHQYQTIIRVAQAAMAHTDVPTLLFGIAAVVIMVTVKKNNPRLPNVLVAVALTTTISYFIGFNKNVYVDISAIHMDNFNQHIAAFNHTVLKIKLISKERAALNLLIDEKHKRLGNYSTEAIQLIRLKSEVAILSLKIKEAKHQAGIIRMNLRSIKLTAVREGDRYIFYHKGDVPSGISSDGRTWRINVHNTTTLDTSNLKIMGGGDVVGTIPEGLPIFTVPQLSVELFFKLLPTAVFISLLGFMEAIVIAKAMAAQTGQCLDPNQELIGQGLANIIGSFSSSYSVSGSFSRSAVNLQAGAVSGISSLVASLVVVVTLLFFTPLLYHLPQAVLAAIILMAVIGLLDFKTFMHSWRAQWYDGTIGLITFLATLYFAPHLNKGILVGVVLSMVVFLYKSMRPVVASLSMNEEKVLKSAEYYRLKGCRHISVVRFDGALFFANASYLDEQVTKFRREQPDLRHILLDARGINDMDSSGEEALLLLIARIRSAGLGFSMSGVKGQVIAVMERTRLLDRIGKDFLFADTNDAVKSIIEGIHNGNDLQKNGCTNCPLTKFVPK